MKKNRTMENKNIKRNRAIEFYRYLMMLPVCIHHINYYAAYSNISPYPFGGGYLVVDFYFLLSGFLLMQHFCNKTTEFEKNNPEKASVNYFWSRYKRFFPHYAYSFCIMAFFFIVVWKAYTVKQIFVGGFWEFFMLQMTGLGNTFPVNGADWYISALLIVSFLVYLLLLKHEKLFLNIIVPISFFAIYAYMFHAYGNLNRYLQYEHFVCEGLLRGFAEVGVGCICYKAYEWLKPYIHGKYRLPSTAFEIAGLSFLFLMLYREGSTTKDFILPLLMAMLIISIFIGNSYLSGLLDNKFSAYLGKISLAVYLNQVVFIDILDKNLKGYPFWPTMVIYIFTLTIYSMFTTWLVSKISNVIKRLTLKLIRI